MRILVVGAGAIGGVTAARMMLGGYDVTLMCNREETAEKIRTEGIHISGVLGEMYVVMKVASSAKELSGVYDAVFIVTKAYDMPDAVRPVLPYTDENSIIVSVQNGICLETLSEIVGRERAAAAVVTWSSTMKEDAHLEITAEGGFVIGRANGDTESLFPLKQAMDETFPTRISDNIIAEMFSKLIINSGVTCGGAMTGQTLGQMLKGAAARRFFIGIVREDMAVADAMGIEVPPFGGKLDYYAFNKGRGIFAAVRRHIVLFAVGLKYRNLTSSSLTALRRKRPTEAPYLNGWVSKKGRELGVSTPINDEVCRIVEEIERGKRDITPENLKEVLEKI